MTDVPFEDPSDDLWGVPDFEGPAHDRPLPDWFSRSKSLLPACRHWREPVVLVDEVVVFASAWFDRPMTGRGVDMSWPDVGFYLDGSWSAAVLVCSPGFRPPFAQRPKGQFVVYPWPDLGAPRDPRRFARALRWLLGQATEGRRVEIGCAGGHGRTGTTLAGLLVLQGLSSRAAIRQVRRAYCEEAIESREQEAFVRGLAGRANCRGSNRDQNPEQRERGGQHYGQLVRVEGERGDGVPVSPDALGLGVRTAVRDRDPRVRADAQD